MKAIKRICGIALILMMTVGFMPMMPGVSGVVNAGTETPLTADGGELSSGSYILNADITLTSNITIASGSNVTLDLNGHVLKGAGGGAVITNKGTLTINDSGSTKEHRYVVSGTSRIIYWAWNDSATGTATNLEDLTARLALKDVIIVKGGAITGGTRGVFNDNTDDSPATFILNGGNIIGNCENNSDDGSGVYCGNATTTMTGGRIIGNYAGYGGGVFNKGSFTMTRGSVDYNKADQRAGGVFNIGSFTMDAGSINYNRASAGEGVGIQGEGGGVTNTGTFIMNGGSIDYNKANLFAGGVKNVGLFKMNAGSISYNEAQDIGGVLNKVEQDGGGYLIGTFLMNGGSIGYNKAVSSVGGVANSGSFTMKAGSISHNEAGGSVGGVSNFKEPIDNSGIFNMTGGSIENNKAGQSIGGVEQKGSMTIGGTAVICGNTAKNKEANLSLGNRISIASGTNALNTGSNIGVTTGKTPTTTAPVQFSTNGTSTDIQYFHSDNDKYCVLYNEGHLELAVETVKLATATNGTIAVDKRCAATNTDVIVTATPAEGYATGEITVKDASGTNLPVETKSDGTFKFTMPTDTNLLPVTVNATFKSPVCFIDNNDNGGFDNGETKYGSIGVAIGTSKPALESESTPTNIVLIADVEENVNIPEGRNVTLDLNGHVLKAKASGSVINNKGTLTIKDSGPTTPHYFEYKKDGAWVATDTNTGAIALDSIASNTNNGAIIEILGGCITGGISDGSGESADNGGICNRGKLTLSGGNVIGNCSQSNTGSGGGICMPVDINGGYTLKMTGGAVVGNHSNNSAGGICVGIDAVLDLDGDAVIAYNSCIKSGGGIRNEYILNMTGGRIFNNCSESGFGGGVYNSGKFNITGGCIKDNQGGGVYQNNTTILGGNPIITGNTNGNSNDNIYLSFDNKVKLGDGVNTKYTDTNGQEISIPAPSSGMCVGVNKDEAGAITSNCTPTDIQYFFSDSDRYYVLYNADHLELAELNVKLADTTNGTITVNDKSAATGTNVTITATPSKGYEVDTITVKDASNTNIPVSTGRNGTYKFTMPTDTNLLPVTVSATFKLKPTPKEPEPVEMSNCEFILDVQALTYTGKAQHPTIIIKDADGNILVEGTDYTVEYPKSTKVGTYTITVTGLGKYKGSGTITYTINPANKTAKKFKSVKAGKKSLTLAWGKASKSYKSQISGYQIMYSTSKDFAKSSTKNAYAKASANTKKLSKLKSKKSYYLKMRAYKTVNGKKYYSEWSKTVVKKTK